MIKGKKIELIPATSDDKQKIYDWCFHSETTKSHAGPPDYPDIPIPSYEEFYEDYGELLHRFQSFGRQTVFYRSERRAGGMYQLFRFSFEVGRCRT
jgi:hypothetical protein